MSSRLTIKKRLLDLDQSVTGLAQAIGCDRAQVSSVISGHRRTPHVRRKIATRLGFSYRALWGTEDPGIDFLPPGPAPRSQSVTHVRDSEGVNP